MDLATGRKTVSDAPAPGGVNEEGFTPAQTLKVIRRDTAEPKVRLIQFGDVVAVVRGSSLEIVPELLAPPASPFDESVSRAQAVNLGQSREPEDEEQDDLDLEEQDKELGFGDEEDTGFAEEADEAGFVDDQFAEGRGQGFGNGRRSGFAGQRRRRRRRGGFAI